MDRILNPLNYINNFAHLSAVLAKDIKQNIDEDEETGKHDNYNDTQELLVLLTGNLDILRKNYAKEIAKLVFKRKFKQKEYLVKEVEERTQEIRSEKDAIQEESEKLAAALKALGEAQDELIRKERMATVGQL